ncbi:MAG: TIR domain-containing protein [Beijerinckiaceae bacterium]|nr:TIR domain-containing protein [Beijerinckiaceae bacterium]
MAKIFISYDRASKDVVEQLVQDLRDDDHQVWFDQHLTGGQSWWDNILSEIRACEILIAALTPAFLESRACQREMNYAKDLQRIRLPVRLSENVLTDSVAPDLSELQWVDYSHPDKQALKSLWRAIRLSRKVPPLPDPLPPAPPVPISYLSSLRAKIDSESQLQKQEQFLLVSELRQQFRERVPAKEIMDLLQHLKRRDDLFATVSQDIDDLTRDIRGEFETEVVQRKLEETVRAEKESYAKEVKKQHGVPGADAPQFSALSSTLTEDLLVRPSAYPMTPMYLLDNAFRIIDWNEAFTVAFDRTMEGRKGRSVLEWTYFLNNYNEVLDHGVKAFGDTNELPPIDVETIEYASLRYGQLTAIKRAYQIPDDNRACMAWLVTLDVKFSDEKQHAAYQRDLIRALGLDLMWTEYAVVYDRLLSNSRVYSELLDKFIGGYDGVRTIPEVATILDLGAGTGNFAHRLITAGRDRVIFAVENNRLMLEMLRAKCQKFLRADALAGGIITIKQDITSLFGLEDDYFDFVTLNNVLYSVQDADSCLAECCRVLKPGGELRLSGPRQDTNLKILFDRIAADLRGNGTFDELQSDYYQALQINELKLRPMLYRWTTKDVEKMLRNAGFSAILHSSEDVYAGQAMYICAVK